MSEPVWIGLETALEIHDTIIEIGPGLPGVRDQGLLISALDRPKNLYFYENSRISHADLATSYAFGIVKNHSFFDANKRTALVVLNSYLDCNLDYFLTDEDEIYHYIITLASGDTSEKEFSEWVISSLKRTIPTELINLRK